MTKALFVALIAGVVVLLAWQAGGNSTASAEVHSGDLHNCDDYATQALAQAHYRENPSDPDDLDNNGDGIACNPPELPCPCDQIPVIDANNDDLNCDNFQNQAAAQDHFNEDTSDPDNLDADNDGIACETLLPCPCDPPDANDTENSNTDNVGSPRARVATGGNLCHEQCVPEIAGECEGDLYSQCPNGLNHSPGFNRPAAMTFISQTSTVPCGAQTNLVARLVYPDGVGAPNRLMQFNSSLGTVRSNLLSDYAGYVQTSFVAPLSPAIVQIDALADGLRQSLQIKVECAQPILPPPSSNIPSVPPQFSPPRTGDGGLVGSDAR